MYTTQEIPMEQSSLHDTGSVSSLHQSVRFSFTPSFLSHGWEYSLSAGHEFPNTHLEASSNLLSIYEDIRKLLIASIQLGKKIQLMQLTTAITRLFL